MRALPGAPRWDAADRRPLPGWLAVLRWPALVALLLGAAFPQTSSAVGIPLPGTLFEVAVVLALPVAALIAVLTGAPRIPRAHLVLAVATLGATGASLAWTTDAASTFSYLMGAAVAVLAFLEAVLLARGLSARVVAGVVSVWVVLLLVPCLLLQLRVPGFLPPADLDPTSSDYLSYYVRLSHPYIGRSNNPAALVAPLILPLVAFALHRRSVAATLGGAVAFGMLVLTMSRGSLLALAVAFILYVLLEPIGRRLVCRSWWVAALIVVLAAGLVVWQVPSASVHVGSRFAWRNIGARFDLLDAAGAQIVAAPWLGIGAGVGPHAHNTFAQQAVWFGVPLGTLLGVLLLWSVLFWFGRGGGAQRWLALAIGAGVAGQVASFAVQSSYEGNLLRSLIWLGWGLLFALYQRACSEPPGAVGHDGADAVPQGPAVVETAAGPTADPEEN